MSLCENRLSCIYALFWVGLIWLVIIPFEIYATLNMLRYRYHPGAQARLPMVVMCSAIFAMLHSLICEQYYYLSSGINIHILHEPSISYIVTLIFPPLFLIMMIIIIFRIYLLHYRINYTVAQSARHWHSLLSVPVATKDFYSRHLATFGHWKYVLRYFIAYAIIGTLTEISITVCEHRKLLPISHNTSHGVHIFWKLTLIIFTAFLFIKTPKFEDAYFVRKEMKYLLYLGSFCLCLYIAMIPLISDGYPIFDQISTSAITMFNFGGVMISECIILNKIKRTDNGFNYGLLKSNMIQKVRGEVVMRVSSLSSGFQQKKRALSSRQLFNILIASPIGINYFVKHIQSEFCIENLLCFIEIIQWLYNVSNKEFAMFDIKPFTDINFKLSTAIPVSSANERSNDKEWNWEQSISLIFKKYIHSSAEYQVNLPYDVQTSFTYLIHLLSIKHQRADGTYTFKHKSNQGSKNRVHNVHFSTKKRTNVEDMTALSDRNETSGNTIALSNPSATAVSASYAIFIETFRKKKKDKLFPNVSAPNSVQTKPICDNKKAQSFQSLHNIQQKNGILNEVYHSNTVIERRSSSEDNELEVVDELVVIDDNYLNGDGYIDPEIRDSFTSSTKMSDIVMYNQKEEKEINKPHLKPKALTLNVAYSLRKSLRKFNSMIRRNSKSMDAMNEEYLKELQMIEDANNLTVFEFVSISCNLLNIILQLNYQSVIRFKRSQHYKNMLDNVNLEQLMNKYGEKGVSWS